MLNVVHIGYGYWGANIARNIALSDKFNLIAICEAIPDRQLKAKENMNASVEITSDYEKFLTDDRVDAFVIATQTELSYSIAMQALSAGKHIFIEKPIATTVERTENLIKVAKENNLRIHCDHIMVHNPVVRYIKNMIDTGELGDIIYIDVSRLNLGPIRGDVNAMLDLAVHDIAVIDYLCSGKDMISLSAYGEKAYGNQETLTYLTIKYDTFIAHIKSSWISPLKERRTMIAGTKKMVIFDDMKNEKLTVYDCGIDMKKEEDYGTYEFQTRIGDIYIPNIPFEDSLKNSLEHFADCVKLGKESLSGEGQSLRVMKILEKAQTDLRKG